MTRSFVPAVLTLAVAAHPAAAQYRSARSAEHLFGAAISGARALWVNPAGMGTRDDATLMAEAVVQRDPAGDFPLSQYTIGFASRGFGFAFRHDGFRVDAGLGPDSLRGVGGNTWRLGFGRGLGKLAIGAAISIYSGDDTKQDVDLGLRYRLAPSLDLALGIEHLGQPVVRDSALRWGGRAGISWSFLGGLGGLDLEAAGADRLAGGSVLMDYRGGVRLQTGGRLPVAVHGVVQLDDGLDVRQLLIGLSVGSGYLGNIVAGGSRDTGTNRLTSISALAQAARRFR